MARTKQKNLELALQIGNVIRAHRKTTGMTQAMLAEAVGLEVETISRMETGKRLPTIEKLLEIADVFRIPISGFFEAVDAVAQQPASDLYAQKICAAINNIPELGKNFVLEVARSYARLHLNKTKNARKKSKID
ncbi:MAG: helix-turn-helix transcriptional regulator [Gallionella sp.]|nr:helix-turn-helix transcriptional regulator [Gallionella sp.]